MRKMRLDLDGLDVQSFTVGFAGGAGTVKGHTGALCVEGDQSWDGQCGGGDTPTHAPRNTCQTCNAGTCDVTCDTCWNTCAGHPSCGNCTYGCSENGTCVATCVYSCDTLLQVCCFP